MTLDSEILTFHAEYLRIVNKDGMFTDHEVKRLEVLKQIFATEPELQKLLIALDVRQGKETAALIEQHRQALKTSKADASIYVDFQNEHRELERRHDQERDRYIRDHQNASDLRRELNEKQQTVAAEQERKFTR